MNPALLTGLCVAALLLTACEEEAPASCAESGVCAAGEVCDLASGECRPIPASAPDLVDLGRHLSAAAGPDGVVHLAMASAEPPALIAGRLEPGAARPTLEAVMEGEGVGEGTSVAIGPDGFPRIAFHHAGRGALMLASFNGTNWEIETVDAGRNGQVGREPALAIDAAGREVVAYRDEAVAGVRVAMRSGRRWSSEVVDAPEGGAVSGGRGHQIRLLLAGGRPVIAHHDSEAEEIRLVVHGDSGWTAGALAGGGRRGGHLSAAMDPLGNVGLSFRDLDRGSLVVAWNDGTDERIETADDGTRPETSPGAPTNLVGAFCSLAFNAAGRPRVAYQDGAEGSLRLALRGAEGWERSVLSDAPISGHGIAQVMLPDGGAVILHRHLAPDRTGRLVGSLAVVGP